MAAVTWTEPALQSLDEICGHIALDNFDVALAFEKRALDASERLALFPRSGRVVPEDDSRSRRELIVGDYRLLYRVNASIDEVEVVAFVHGARLMAAILRQLDTQPQSNVPLFSLA